MDKADGATLAYVIVCLGIGAVLVLLIIRRMKREAAATNWPTTKATIQSGEVEEISFGRGSEELPVFKFSYQVDGTDQSGCFLLWARGDQADAVLRSMVKKKITVGYDPERPSSYYIPDEYIEGCQVSLVPGSKLRSES